MDDLISRQAAIEAMCWACGHDCDKIEFVYNAPQDEQVIMCPEHYALSTLPSAQPEIIRCKDCTKRVNCRTSNVWAVAPGDDWYCADAERRRA